MKLEDLKNITGIIHAGGHYAEEYEYYHRLCGDNQLWFEPLPHCYSVMRDRLPPTVKTANFALGNDNRKVTMHLASNNCESSSILEPRIHQQLMPVITFNGICEVSMITLDSYLDHNPYNTLVLDVQGYELEVLKGATKTLQNIDYIWTEVNFDYLYDGCALIGDLDSFLLDFQRVYVSDYGGWGDALYIRKDKKILKVIVAKYQEDVEWTKNIPLADVIVINKDPAVKTDYDLPNDAGRECSSYLDYIVKNYDSLEGEYLFTQGRYTDQAPELLAELFNRRYFGHQYECRHDGAPHWITPYAPAPLHTYSHFLGIPLQSHYRFKCGCFMRLNAQHIRAHPRSFYELMLRVAQNDPESSHCIERLWAVIFPVLKNDTEG